MMLFLFFVAFCGAQSQLCIGEFQYCPTTKTCALDSSLCGTCTEEGQYLCPNMKDCVETVEDFAQCPDLNGTLWDATLPIEHRIEAVLNQATVEEMIPQLMNDAPAILRLGIPAYNWLNDDEHGVKLKHATSFPSGNALGATWDKDILFDVGNAIAIEARGLHNGFVMSGDRGHGENGHGITIYAPNLNLVRDPRWGRAQEVFSEDPCLTSKLVERYVKGMQDMSSGGPMLGAACCKHYAAYDLETLPIDRYHFNVEIDSRNLWETYLPAFRSCVVKASGAHVMCSYNALQGVPTCAHPDLLNGVLREQWGWKGFIISDYDAWAQIKDTHQYCDSYECAAAVGFKSGLDQEGGGSSVIDAMPSALKQGLIAVEDIKTSFKRLLRTRVQLGMFDPPATVGYNYLSNDTEVVLSEDHLKLAHIAAQKALCLYKNDNNTLPLAKKSITKLAVIGSHAAQTALLQGNYAVPTDAGSISVLQGLAHQFGHTFTDYKCSSEVDTDYYQPGIPGMSSPNATDCCMLCTLDPDCTWYTWFNGQCYKKNSDEGRKHCDGCISGQCQQRPIIAPIVYAPGCDNTICKGYRFDEAVTAAEGADAIIMTLGLSQELESEGKDRSTIELPVGQQKLFDAVRGAHPQTPLIVVLIHGGTLALGDVADKADAVLDAWYPGMFGGEAIAEALFGVFSPAGRAGVTSYRSTSDLPPAGEMDLYKAGLTYRYFSGKPLYPFGYGLSYTSFRYANLVLSKAVVQPCEEIDLTVTVTNVGAVGSEEVVQVYIKQPNATVPVPNVRLADFERVFIPSGKSVTVRLSVLPEFHFEVQDDKRSNGADIFHPDLKVESGWIEVYVGGGQPDFADQPSLKARVSVEGSAHLEDCPSW